MTHFCYTGYLIRRKKTFVFTLKPHISKLKQLCCFCTFYCRFTLSYTSAIFSVGHLASEQLLFDELKNVRFS